MQAKSGIVAALTDSGQSTTVRPLTAARPGLSKLDSEFAAAAGKTTLPISIAHLNFSTTYRSERIGRRRLANFRGSRPCNGIKPQAALVSSLPSGVTTAPAVSSGVRA